MGGYMIPQLYVPPLPGIHFVGATPITAYPAYSSVPQAPGYNIHYALPPNYYTPSIYPASGPVYAPNNQPPLNTQPPQTPALQQQAFPQKKIPNLKPLEKLTSFLQGAKITFLPALLMGAITFLCQPEPFASKAVLKSGLKKSALWTILFIALGGCANLLLASPHSRFQRLKRSQKPIIPQIASLHNLKEKPAAP